MPVCSPWLQLWQPNLTLDIIKYLLGEALPPPWTIFLEPGLMCAVQMIISILYSHPYAFRLQPLRLLDFIGCFLSWSFSGWCGFFFLRLCELCGKNLSVCPFHWYPLSFWEWEAFLTTLSFPCISSVTNSSQLPSTLPDSQLKDHL